MDTGNHRGGLARRRLSRNASGQALRSLPRRGRLQRGRVQLPTWQAWIGWRSGSSWRISEVTSGDRARWSRSRNRFRPRDVADVVAYYAKLPVFADPQDNRIFPQARPDPSHAAIASRLISFGDGERGIPPCQACHGPVAYRPGVPSLATQNADYVLNQLEAFASRTSRQRYQRADAHDRGAAHRRGEARAGGILRFRTRA